MRMFIVFVLSIGAIAGGFMASPQLRGRAGKVLVEVNADSSHQPVQLSANGTGLGDKHNAMASLGSAGGKAMAAAAEGVKERQQLQPATPNE